jgi:outer membrane protein OmpU
MGSNFTLSGSGDLDNGWNVALSIAMTNANAYSNTNVVIGIPGIGDVRIDQGTSGTGIDRMDNKVPTVWEEADGAGLSAGIANVTGVSAGANVEITPEGMPDGLTVRFAVSPNADTAATTGDKATGGDSGVYGSGWDLTATASDAMHGIAGLTVYGGISQVETNQNSSAYDSDGEETVLGASYAMGGFTVGYQINDDETGRASTNTKYENTYYSITFNVNDDLSIGYGHAESDVSTTTNVTAEADSIQAAYTMGGATLRIADVDVENQAYSTSAGTDKEATIISLGLAF